ncbi:MAG: FHA domain-containing serine/threonine-protein kinase [Planctomycetota bacterium]
MIRLLINEDGAEVEREFPGQELVVGRSRSCDIVLKGHGTLSRRHCMFRVSDDRVVAEDMSSRHGVRVNGIYMQQGLMKVGDYIDVGDVRISLMGFGADPEEDEAEQVRPCLQCGYVMAFDEPKCPQCSRAGQRTKKRMLDPYHLPGYRLVRRLGSGGMGIVFEARREEDDATVALKILKPHLAKHPSYLVRFVEETRVLTLLRHPNIVQIYGRGSEKDLTWIDMEYVNGDSVRHMIRREGRIEETVALEMIWQVVLALDYAAQQKIIHGDVKPSNFLIDEVNRVKLCDFGLARFFSYSMAGRGRVSPEISSQQGTAAYAAPERFLANSKPDLAGDVYSLGVSLFQMTTGVLPFGTNKAAVQHLDRSKTPDPRALAPTLRRATGMLIQRMMEPKPQHRYRTYRDLQDDLALLLD